MSVGCGGSSPPSRTTRSPPKKGGDFYYLMGAKVHFERPTDSKNIGQRPRDRRGAAHPTGPPAKRAFPLRAPKDPRPEKGGDFFCQRTWGIWVKGYKGLRVCVMDCSLVLELTLPLAPQPPNPQARKRSLSFLAKKPSILRTFAVLFQRPRTHECFSHD